jgi:hypothetical protein
MLLLADVDLRQVQLNLNELQLITQTFPDLLYTAMNFNIESPYVFKNHSSYI